jgi:AcrR family transcriptional regulator
MPAAMPAETDTKAGARAVPSPSGKPSQRKGNPESTGAPRARRKQHERVAESDRRMMEAALRLIGERGYRGTSLAAIGEEAGYSRGLVHERFGSKSGLLWALVKQMLRVWNHESRSQARDRAKGDGSSSTGIDGLCELLDNHRRAVLEDRGIRTLYALMFEALGPTPDLLPEFRELHRGFRADIERRVRAGVQAGTIRADVDPKAQAALLLAAQRGLAFQWLLDPDGFSIEAAYDELKRNLRRTLAP